MSKEQTLIRKALKERPFKIVISSRGYRVRNNYLPLSTVRRHRIGNDGQWRITDKLRVKVIESYDKGNIKNVRKYLTWMLIVMDNNRTVNALNGHISSRPLPNIDDFMNNLSSNIEKFRVLNSRVK